MNRHPDFWKKFFGNDSPSYKLLVAFLLGIAVVGFLSNLAYDLLVDPTQVWESMPRILALSFVLTLLAYLLYQWDARKRATYRLTLGTSAAPPSAGLIWVLGPGLLTTLIIAMNHHLSNGGKLKHVWLLMSDTDSVKKRHQEFVQEITQRGLRVQPHPIYLNDLDAKSVYESVCHTIHNEAEEFNLSSSQIIADVTGGLKPLTTGLVLAALTIGCPIEYVETQRDAQGRPIGTPRVVKVDLTFYPTPELP